MPMSMPPVTVVPGPFGEFGSLLLRSRGRSARAPRSASVCDSTEFNVDQREVGLDDVGAVGGWRDGDDRLGLDAVGRIPAVHVVLQREVVLVARRRSRPCRGTILLLPSRGLNTLSPL